MIYRMLVFCAFMIVAGSCSPPGKRFEAIPLPADVNIVPPSDSIPKDIAAFSGRWEGGWYGKVTNTHMADQILIVEKFHSPTSVQVAVAGVSHWGRTSGQEWSQRFDAKFVDGALQYTTRDGNALVTYRMSPDGTLEGNFETVRGSNDGTFVRVAQ